jgi:hypothetical protein
MPATARGPSSGQLLRFIKDPRKGSGPLPPHPDQLIQRLRQGALHPLCHVKAHLPPSSFPPFNFERAREPAAWVRNCCTHAGRITSQTYRSIRKHGSQPSHPKKGFLEVSNLRGSRQRGRARTRIEALHRPPLYSGSKCPHGQRGTMLGVRTARHRLGLHCCPLGCRSLSSVTPSSCTS